MRGLKGLAAVVLAGACAAPAAGCGGGGGQDAGQASGPVELEVTNASFPSKQSIADATELTIEVRNNGDEAAPDVAVTIATDPGDSGGAAQAFASDIQDTDVASRSRPIWIVDEGPSGGDTAYTNTWALGRLEAGASRRFAWKLTAVKPGRYRVTYAVSPGLTGSTRLASGGDGKGSFRVEISDTPPAASVDDAGNVVRGGAS